MLFKKKFVVVINHQPNITFNKSLTPNHSYLFVQKYIFLKVYVLWSISGDIKHFPLKTEYRSKMDIIKHFFIWRFFYYTHFFFAYLENNIPLPIFQKKNPLLSSKFLATSFIIIPPQKLLYYSHLSDTCIMNSASPFSGY